MLVVNTMIYVLLQISIFIRMKHNSTVKIENNLTLTLMNIIRYAHHKKY